MKTFRMYPFNASKSFMAQDSTVGMKIWWNHWANITFHYGYCDPKKFNVYIHAKVYKIFLPLRLFLSFSTPSSSISPSLSSSLVLYLKVKWWFRNETKIDHMHKPYSCGLSSGYRFFGDFQFHIHWHSLSTQTRIRDWAIVGYWAKSGNKRGVRWNDGTKQ